MDKQDLNTNRPIFGLKVKRYWWIIGLFALFLLLQQIYDLKQSSINQADLIVDLLGLLLFLVLLVLIGILVFLLARAIRLQSQTMKILEYKNKVWLDLIKSDDWDVLTAQLAKIPATIAGINETSLFLRSQDSSHLDEVAHWIEDHDPPAGFFTSESCEICIRRKLIHGGSVYTCRAAPNECRNQRGNVKQCLPIQYGDHILALMQMSLKPGEEVSQEQKMILQNINDEMAQALKAGQDRKNLFEFRAAETSFSERQKFSHLLHDQLGQNLGFLRLKLGQMSQLDNWTASEMLKSDLDNMQHAVSDSYEIMRGILEQNRTDAGPALTHLLLEHIRKISQRGELEIQFKTCGRPILLPIESQRAVFFAFQEVLSNIEKHSHARAVSVQLAWQELYLELKISDNGTGFDPQLVNTTKHFGLQIMRERISSVNGWIDMTSSENSGTSVLICVPYQNNHQVKHADGVISHLQRENHFAEPLE
jgi:signal transduction histidine kinase